ncbi:hypothetical protein J6590_060981 [Homalodisca vitripennis]|nr:hypothetical protein J6590_060981 [Homalodisca vitripennis]
MDLQSSWVSHYRDFSVMGHLLPVGSSYHVIFEFELVKRETYVTSNSELDRCSIDYSAYLIHLQNSVFTNPVDPWHGQGSCRFSLSALLKTESADEIGLQRDTMLIDQSLLIMSYLPNAILLTLTKSRCEHLQRKITTNTSRYKTLSLLYRVTALSLQDLKTAKLQGKENPQARYDRQAESLRLQGCGLRARRLCVNTYNCHCPLSTSLECLVKDLNTAKLQGKENPQARCDRQAESS